MLFHVRMDVAIPHDLDPAERDKLLATEKARAQELQRRGTWVHLWRVVGRYSNISVFDVASPDELHTSSGPSRSSSTWQRRSNPPGPTPLRPLTAPPAARRPRATHPSDLSRLLGTTSGTCRAYFPRQVGRRWGHEGRRVAAGCRRPPEPDPARARRSWPRRAPRSAKPSAQTVPLPHRPCTVCAVGRRSARRAGGAQPRQPWPPGLPSDSARFGGTKRASI